MGSTPAPANMIVIVAESHNPNMFGCYGDSFARTPNLDKLAQRGVAFSNAYCASPICVAARASIATGQYPHQTGYWDNSLPYDGNVESWMHRLRNAGHRVDAIGKLHFQDSEIDNGFSHEIDTMHVADGVGELIGLLRCDNQEPDRTGLWKLWSESHGIGTNSVYRDYDERITQSAIDWIEENGTDTEKPWVLCVHYVSTHAPFRVPEEDLALFQSDKMPDPISFEKEERPHHPALDYLREKLCHPEDLDIETIRTIKKFYYALVMHLDRQVGKILGALEEKQLTESTRVLYTSDHGFSLGDHFILGLFNLYEHTARVPLILAGPGIPKNGEIKEIASHVDLFPTIIESVSGIQPEHTDNLPGLSLWPAIQGVKRDRIGFAEYHAIASSAGTFMVREGDMKLIHHTGMAPQLFDLGDDPMETRDLIELGKAAPTAQRLEEKLRVILDPEETDQRAKTDQRRKVQEHGGLEQILKRRGEFSFSPPPGVRWEDMEGTIK